MTRKMINEKPNLKVRILNYYFWLMLYILYIRIQVINKRISKREYFYFPSVKSCIKLSGSNEAPPTKNPSISFCWYNSAIFLGDTLPPYWTIKSSEVIEWMYSQISWAISGVATLPVPIAQIGS
ncbi:Hypothetical protein MCYN_0407 [Mycoplasmopsis cynos C142]|uniref:Uncharacterized protein n=1 Tax=Mycoplasmopsis cynos (strain C142) TaxID=1246955 RepID=L0RUN5_MYCC1|nr:Hypothetical protein MCYN_0407 [Mycoplasmopsis cynos C142]